MKSLGRKTKFSQREWFFANDDENLFHLSREELFIYRQLLKVVS